MDLRQLSTRVSQEPAPLQKASQSRDRIAVPERNASAFEATLEKARQELEIERQAVHLSAHAVERLAQRDISMTPQDQKDLARAVDILDQKGARDALILREDAAFVVNIPNRTLVTAISHSELQQRIFTQIDSTMLL